MKRAALVALLAAGCATIQAHPYATATVANTALVVGAGACAFECGPGAARGISDGVLVTELALSSMMSLLAIEFFAAYTEHNQ